LINDPEIVLADEPTGALDSKSGKEIMQIFLEMKQKSKTILMVTHTPEVAKYADRIIYVRDGTVVDNDYKLRQSDDF
jgi:putative ABC transport system ATP-binding protein